MLLLTPCQVRIRLLLVFIAFSTTLYAQKKHDKGYTEFYEVPNLDGRLVHDEAKMLEPETVSSLEGMLTNYQNSTGHPVAVLTLHDVRDDLSTFCRQVIHQWRLGQKNKDGVLFLIIEKSREMRIEVGDGLIYKLTPGLCADIISNEIVPSYKEKDYDKGTLAGIQAILSGIEGRYAPAAPPSMSHMALFMIVASIVVVIASLVGLFSRYYAYAFYGGLLPFYALTLGMNFSWWAVGAYAAAFPLLRLLIVKTKMPQLGFGKNATGGKHTEDSSDVMAHRQAIFNSSSSSSSDSDSGSSSSDDSGASGHW